MYCMFFKKTSVIVAISLLVLNCKVHGQELFILNEPASSVPKGVVGVRIYSHHYKEFSTTRNMGAIRLMFGATSKLSIMATASMSNHHSRKLPKDLVNHTHVGNQTNYFTQSIKRGVDYPYLFTGINVFAKYRFLSIDERYKHFRMAAYGEWSASKVAHDEAEPNLTDDNGGYGFGMISTWLKNRLALSLTTGFIKPNSYSETQPDFTGGPDLPTTIEYGNAIKYNFSLGYRLSPKKYEAYEQVNWNIYVEITGKSYGAARVIQNGTELKTRTAALRSGTYVEISPGLQRIINSNTRVEFCYTFSLIGTSFAHFPTAWTLGVQRYFYGKPKGKINM